MITSRSEIKPQFDTLLAQEINSYEQLVSWIQATDDLDSQLSQDYAWRYIHQTVDTVDEEFKKSYLDFTQQIYPEWIRVSDQIGRKLISSEFISQLPPEYANLIRSTKHSVEMFREANVELSSKEKEIEAQFAEIM
jgi:oligoendopeptidase F